MKIEIVTPAGRQRYLEVLFLHLKSQKADFDQWTLWVNTLHEPDIEYCKKLERENSWIRTIDLSVEFGGCQSVSSFYKHARDSKTLYIKLDDDIVWMEDDFIKKLSKFRLENPEYFLIFPNIINNANCDHIHQKIGALDFNNGVVDYGSHCFIGHGHSMFPDSPAPRFAELKHRNFLEKFHLSSLDDYKFNKWVLIHNERFSINCASWLGKHMAKVEAPGGWDSIKCDEQFLTIHWPMQKNLINAIYGQVLCCHFAFCTQRNYMDNSNALEEYRMIAERKR